MINEWVQLELWSTRIAAITAVSGAIYGLYRFVKSSLVKVFGMANKINMISEQLVSNGGSSLRDCITRIEARQIQVEQRERAFLHTHPSMMYELDEHLSLVWANRIFLDNLDVDSDVVSGYGWHNIISESDRRRIIEQFAHAKESSRSLSTTAKLIVSQNINNTVNATVVGTVMRDSRERTSGYLVTITLEKKK